MTLLCVLPIRTVSAANAREHWRVKAGRVKKERAITRLACLADLRGIEGAGDRVAAVTFTRVAPRLLDDDNLASGFKAIRDEVAAFLGVSDAPGGPVRWRYEQRRGEPRQYAAVIEVELRDPLRVGETSPGDCDADLSQAGRGHILSPQDFPSLAPPAGTSGVGDVTTSSRGPGF